jgi:Zn-dependent protease
MENHTFIYYLLMLPGAFFAPVIHESVKAMCSARQGDPTPKRNGFLSHNPLKYFEVVGFFCMLIFNGYGWGQPVPTTPMYYKNRRNGVLITYITPSVVNLLTGIIAAALAGLIGNVVFSYIYTPQIPDWLFGVMYYSTQTLILFARCNITLALFNILPVFPLDGLKILQLYIKPDWAIRVTQYEKIFQIILLILLGLGIIGRVFDPIANGIVSAAQFNF